MEKTELKINDWWSEKSAENIWMEITGRPDIGADLKAPQFSDDGQTETYSYTLTKHTTDGDIVLHYNKHKKEIGSYSIVDGACYADDIIWKALGSSAAKTDTKPYSRPGWKVGLRNFQYLKTPVKLENLRFKSEQILKIKEDMQTAIRGSLYFPFSFSKNKLHGAVQGYLVKFPKSIADEFEQLRDLSSKNINNSPVFVEQLGTSYRQADEDVAITRHKPFEHDPDVIDRGSKAHRRIQNSLANFLLQNGITPESPSNSKINFDIGWQVNETYFIAEIKSITVKNEEKQLRLGLGQVLRYMSLVDKQNISKIVPVLIAEKVSDVSWYKTCESQNVRLVASDDFKDLLS